MIDGIKAQAYWRLMRADKPIGTYLLLWPTLWGLWLASEGVPSVHILLVFVFGVVLMRAAGCVINDFADRHFDGQVERTKQRPLVTGEVSAKEALVLFTCLVLAAFALVLTLDWRTIALSFVGLALAASYPFMKRYTYLPQFVLGAAFSWGIVMAFMAIQGSIPWWGWALYLANLCWTVAYDTLYAMVDRDDDIGAGIKSSALLFGRYDILAVFLLQLATLALLYWIYTALDLGWFAMASLVLVSLLFALQHRMIRGRNREAYFKAFLHNNYVGLVVALGLVLDFAIPL